MVYETLLYEVQDGVATLTLNRPEVYNAMNNTMYTELLDVLKQVTSDSSVRALIITGAGKAFCSGADIATFDLSQTPIPVGNVLRSGLNRIILGLRRLEKPVVCALNGVAAGAGSSLTLACDVRIASEDASYVFAAFVNIGIIPDGGVTYLLPQIVGPARAFELAMFADGKNRLTSHRALEYGLVNRVVSSDALMTETNELAGRFAGMATKAVGLTKRAMNRATDAHLASALEYEAQLQEVTFATQDFREGVHAFMGKRPARFNGD